MTLDELTPLERRPAPGDAARAGAEAAARLVGLPHWTDAERGALSRALLLQRLLSAPHPGYALERVGGFEDRAGARYRCLPRRAGAAEVDIEQHSGGVCAVLVGLWIAPQRIVRDAPLALLSANPNTGLARVVVYIDAIQRIERAQELDEVSSMTHDPPLTGGLAEAELELKALCDRGAWDEAMALIGRVHGPTVRGMLLKKLGDESEAHDVWLRWYESVRKALEGFRWESRFSTWSYRIAVNAFFAHKRRQGREVGRAVPWEPEMEGRLRDVAASALEREHDPTLDWVKTTNIHSFRSICQAHLGAEDRELLQWRLHANRPWAEIARELTGADASPADLKKAVQRLHVRYHRLIKKLHALAVREGLVSPRPDVP